MLVISIVHSPFPPRPLPPHQRPHLCTTHFFSSSLCKPWRQPKPAIRTKKIPNLPPRASLLESPVMWVGRMCVFYALIKAGVAGTSSSSPLITGFTEEESGNSEGDYGFSKWVENLQGNSDDDKEGNDRRKLVSKWHPTTKGTLKRSYRVPSKLAGQRLLKSIASLLSEDDHFIDATSHKGCQIRRQSAHSESVCCNNIRALFDELPTPHMVVEITPFPAGPLTDKDYTKAEKLEKVLRSTSSI